jgi:hypothetical protein
MCVYMYVSIRVCVCVCVRGHCETRVLPKGLSELMGHRLYVCVYQYVCVCATA